MTRIRFAFELSGFSPTSSVATDGLLFFLTALLLVVFLAALFVVVFAIGPASKSKTILSYESSSVVYIVVPEKEILFFESRIAAFANGVTICNGIFKNTAIFAP